MAGPWACLQSRPGAWRTGMGHRVRAAGWLPARGLSESDGLSSGEEAEPTGEGGTYPGSCHHWTQSRTQVPTPGATSFPLFGLRRE